MHIRYDIGDYGLYTKDCADDPTECRVDFEQACAVTKC